MRDESENGQHREPPEVRREVRLAPRVGAAELDRKAHAEQDAEHRPEAFFEEKRDGLFVDALQPAATGRGVAEVHQEHADESDAAKHVQDVKALTACEEHGEPDRV